ncbi:hypothetical protein PUNSTDRAFT_114198 [Punctularia strigosozonata HHB-11173 SS5]|uniref:uncharacterized protein n=1 Tax=Punctularia strigosozonata (strain HHB-11173) TaxID=741275 RepID=UPI00044171FC|nr:uncharacterized protein PUNSTDRAFT_114198 [Punctularia strigosozonata HHB-11173 SS5]EIN07712.1 hypothetical protein PUNSTDRAFT_114198 [Punctularia strigosozonata HHB-11173 SS5]
MRHAEGRRTAVVRRNVSTVTGAESTSIADDVRVPPVSDTKTRDAWLFVDSVFPVRLGAWDLRHYIGVFREDTLLEKLSHILSNVSSSSRFSFKPLSLESHHKEGGVFVHFSYALDKSDDAAKREDIERVLGEIEKEVRAEAAKDGGVPNWIGLGHGRVWTVKGHPWREDLDRYASPIVKVAFEGPDVREEMLYDVLRPYGRIQDIGMPTPPPAGSLRTATVSFRSLSAATVARNVMHGFDVVPGGSSPSTRLRLGYQPPVQAHVIRDWLSSHPRIVIPVVVSLLLTFTYTVFDPIRTWMIEGKVGDWFEYQDWALYRWLTTRLPSSLGLASHHDEILTEGGASHEARGWKDREDAAGAMERYLTDLPNTITFVHGPQGSGKGRMLEAVITAHHRKALIIDCNELFKKSSDSQLVGALAEQTGYWPIFTFLNSASNLLDLAAVGLIGQKAGLSTSLTEQLKQVLDITATALHRVSASHRTALQRRIKEEEKRESMRRERERRRQRIRDGTWHDPRMDCVAGNGVMSELGIGDEIYAEADDLPTGVDKDAEEKKEAVHTTVDNTAEESRVDVVEARLQDKAASVLEMLGKPFGGSGSDEVSGRPDPNATPSNGSEQRREGQDPERKQRSVEDVEAVNSLPIVVLKNFVMRAGANEEVLNVLATWAASLAENKIAHVVVVSDNRENAKRLAKALPSKPLNAIALYDADAASALSYVKQKLNDAGVNIPFSGRETEYVERLGGRASDLESLIHKVRNGQSVQEAVEDIIRRDVGELRKNAFGDDAEDAKNLPWSREQAWTLVKKLSKADELPYYDVLIDFPFKGDETALRSMEHAELVAIGTDNGRPTTIRPGKPVYKYVFQQVAQDRVFQATQDIAINEKLIASAESTVKACEEELLTLKEIRAGESSWWSSSTRTREKYLVKKMQASEGKIEQLEKQNAELKKVLAKTSHK